MHVGDGIGRKISKSSSGYQLKHLFMGHQGTLGIATRATLKLYPKPEAELSPFWAFDNYDDAYRCTGALARAGVATFAGAVLFDEYKVAYLRRDDEAYIPQPADVRALVCAVMYGYEDEVRAGGQAAVPDREGARRPLPRRRDLRGRLGGAARPLRHPAARPDQGRPGGADELALRGRRDQLHQRAGRHQGLARDRRRPAAATDVFDDWGMFAYTSADTGVDYLTEIDVGIWEQQTRRRGVGAVGARPSARSPPPRCDHGGSISACHGSCREGEVDLVPDELGRGFEVMLDVKRTLDPEQHHESGQVPPGPGLPGRPSRRRPRGAEGRRRDELTATPSRTPRPNRTGQRCRASPRSSTSSRSTRG